MGEVAKDLKQAGVSATGQRIGGYVTGLASVFGGKYASRMMNAGLMKSFGKNLQTLTNEDFAAINEHLAGEGVSLTAKGLVMGVAEGAVKKKTSDK